MAEIPVPAWQHLDNSEFLFHQIQTTRGCPFKCRFCSVPDISGSSFRFKPVDNVIAELRAMPRSGYLKDKMKAVYIVDDNFISRLRYTRELLTAMAPLYAAGEIGEWSAETTLNVANDRELLDLFAAAGCGTLIIGIESINEATLLDMDKKVNFSLSYQEAIERIHARGMSIVGNFIVGFDTDTTAVFRDILDFVDDNNILYPFFSILTPMPGTKLHDDYLRQGRLDHLNWADFDTRHVVFEPARMTREQLMDGYIWLYEQAYTGERALNRLSSYWKRYGKRRSGLAERAFIKWRLRKFAGGGTARFRKLLDDGWRHLLEPGVRSDVGQLLYYFDSAHFVDYLDRFRSPSYAENVSLFATANNAAAQELGRKQWQAKRVKRQRQKAGPTALPVL